MTTIFPGFGNVKYVVNHMADDICTDEVSPVISSANVGGVGVVTATWPAFNCVLDGKTQYLPIGHIDLNSADVATPTTYYVYIEDVAGTPTAKASTTNPITNPAVGEFFLMNVLRFKSVGATVTYYYNKYPTQNGVYELAHNLKEDSLFFTPAWIEGLAVTMTAGGKVSTAAGYVRFPGNEPRPQAIITEGALVLESEASNVAGIDNIATYVDGSAITAGKFFKVLVGVIRDKGSLNTAKYMVVRQGKPSVEYATRAEALIDGDAVAAGSFPSAYLAAITPLCYIISEMTAGATSDYTQSGAYATGDIIDLREGGLTGSGGGGASITNHSLLSNLNVVGDHTGYVTLDGARPLTGNWTAAKNITTVGTLSGSQLISTIADGTKPLDITSKTMTTNLNADMVDGVHEASFVLADGSRALTGNWAAAKDITTVGNMGSAAFTASGLAKADTFQSTHAIGVAPYTATSTTMCTNLNADAVDGIQGANIVTADGLTPLTAAWDVGSWQVRAETFQSDIATIAGAPFTVASATVVTNLNADTVDGNHATAFAVAAKGVTNGDTHDHSGGDGAQIAHSGLSGLTSPADDHTQYLLADGTRALSGNWAAGSKNITTTGNLSGSQVVSTIADGTKPFDVTSKTVTTNLNADMLDGLHSTSFLLADGTQNLTGNLSVTGGVTIDGVDISAHAININAHHTIVTIADGAAAAVLGLTDQEIDLDTQTASLAFMGPAAGGAAAKPAFRAIVPEDITPTQGTMTLANGANDNVDISASPNAVVFLVSGPGKAFTIDGITGGREGRTIVIYNGTGQNMSLAHDNAGSTAANRIYTSTAATVSTTANGFATLVYTAGSINRWLLTSIAA